jgi:hypothetical protein
MFPPINTLEMIKFMHDEVHEKREQSQLREIAAQHSESRFGRISRLLFRRPRPDFEACGERDLIEPSAV